MMHRNSSNGTQTYGVIHYNSRWFVRADLSCFGERSTLTELPNWRNQEVSMGSSAGTSMAADEKFESGDRDKNQSTVEQIESKSGVIELNSEKTGCGASTGSKIPSKGKCASENELIVC